MSLSQQLKNKFHKQGKWGMVLLSFYIFLWIFFMSKKMDFLFFPYNDMFANGTNNKSVYCVLKVNGKVVPISDKFYWKKDLLEQSISNYVKYLKNENKRYIDQFFLSRMDKNLGYDNIYANLKLPVIHFKDWSKWYLHQLGRTSDVRDTVEIIEIHWEKIGDSIVITDSITLNSVEL